MSKTTPHDDVSIEELTREQWQARMSEFANMAIDASECGQNSQAEYFWGIAATAMRAAAILERRAARHDGTKPSPHRDPHEEIEIEKLSVPQGELRVRHEPDPKRRRSGMLNDFEFMNDTGWLVLGDLAEHVLEIRQLPGEWPMDVAVRFCPEIEAESSGVQKDRILHTAAEKILREQSPKIRRLLYSE